MGLKRLYRISRTKATKKQHGLSISLALIPPLWHNTRMGRWMRFLLIIAIGIAIGLVYGWIINPVEYVDTAPDSLRLDYKTDYVLMVAEAYQVEQNLDLAVRRLAVLGNIPSQDLVVEAIAYAAQIQYDPADLVLMQALVDGLKTWYPGLEAPLP